MVWGTEMCCLRASGLDRFLRDAGYVGPIDLTFQYDGTNHWFLEWCPRIGYDAFFGLVELIPGGLVKFFCGGFAGVPRTGYASTARVSLPPYPNLPESGRVKAAEGAVVRHAALDHWWLDIRAAASGGIECAGSDGVLGVVTAFGEEPAWSVQELKRSLSKIRVAGDLQFRSDTTALVDAWRTIKHRPWGVSIGAAF
jgi:hypothetical protein